MGICVAEWLRCSDSVKMWVIKCWNMCSWVVKMLGLGSRGLQVQILVWSVPPPVLIKSYGGELSV